MVRDRLDKFHVGLQRRLYVNFFPPALPFPQIEYGMKRGGVGAGERGDCGYGFPFVGRLGMPEGDERVPEQRAEGRNWTTL